MRLLALDASTTHIGWAVYRGRDLISHGTHKLGGGALRSLEPYGAAAIWLYHKLGDVEPDVVVIEEDLPGGKARGGHVDRALSRMVGALVAICALGGCAVELVNNQTIKSAYGLPRRTDKAAAIRLANMICDDCGVDHVADDHAADAVLIGNYSAR